MSHILQIWRASDCYFPDHLLPAAASAPQLAHFSFWKLAEDSSKEIWKLNFIKMLKLLVLFGCTSIGTLLLLKISSGFEQRNLENWISQHAEPTKTRSSFTTWSPPPNKFEQSKETMRKMKYPYFFLQIGGAADCWTSIGTLLLLKISSGFEQRNLENWIFSTFWTFWCY